MLFGPPTYLDRMSTENVHDGVHEPASACAGFCVTMPVAASAATTTAPIKRFMAILSAGYVPAFLLTHNTTQYLFSQPAVAARNYAVCGACFCQTSRTACTTSLNVRETFTMYFSAPSCVPFSISLC